MNKNMKKNNAPATVGCTDVPITGIEDDRFSIGVYVDGLCHFILGCETPMTISVQGDWGSGKTSMMNMVNARLKEQICPIWFNTWQFSQFDMGNSLVFSMMDVLLEGLGCGQDKVAQIMSGIKGIAKNAVYVLTDQVSGAAASTMQNVLEGSSRPADYAKEIVSLKKKFQSAVNEKLEKENKQRVVVFVDDLDRLQPQKAVELLEVLKLFLDCENCVFVLAVDYEVVMLGVRQKFGLEVSESKGRSFFDKIIQLPFKMPVAQYDVVLYVNDVLGRMQISTDDADTQLFYNLIRTSIGFNPRSMKRLFNTFQLLKLITDETAGHIPMQYRWRVLFATVCAQTCFEQLYRYLVMYPVDVNDLCQLRSDAIPEDILNKIYEDADPVYVANQVKQLRLFMPYFVDALQQNRDTVLTDYELESLRVILKCSAVTSVIDTAGAADLTEEYKSRNRELASTVAGLLGTCGKFSISSSARQLPEYLKYSDVVASCKLNTKYGFVCRLEFCLTRMDASTIGMHVFVKPEAKGAVTVFKNMLRPEKLGTTEAIVDDNPFCYRYMNVVKADVTSSEATVCMADAVREYYTTISSVFL